MISQPIPIPSIRLSGHSVLMPRYRRYFSDGDWVFVTIVTADRRPWLGEVESKRMLLQTLRTVKRHFGYRHLAHVVLDDHLHWMLIADGSAGVSRLVSSLKLGVLQRRRSAGLAWKRLWQPRFYDHILRDENDLRRHLDYIHFNPVKHGYVDAPRDYPWSSFRAWQQRGHYDEDWGKTEPHSTSNLDYE
ncbi:MAG: transposase [Wenzhouxiangella sp.]|jgi:putative transposase|nr:transposase [Wenzhouxiangella sp.]